jgi:hypothetical protein
MARCDSVAIPLLEDQSPIVIIALLVVLLIISLRHQLPLKLYPPIYLQH